MVTHESQKTSILLAIASFATFGKKYTVTEFSGICSASSLIHNLVTMGLDMHKLHEGCVESFIEHVRKNPESGEMLETIRLLKEAPDIDPDDVIEWAKEALTWYRSLLADSDKRFLHKQHFFLLNLIG